VSETRAIEDPSILLLPDIPNNVEKPSTPDALKFLVRPLNHDLPPIIKGRMRLPTV
jgi:hypothetical protein